MENVKIILICLFIALTNIKCLDQDRKVIETYIVNKTNREFIGKYTFSAVEGVAIKHVQENNIKISPSHKQTLQLLGYKNLSNKLQLNCASYSTSYILLVDKFAISITDMTGATVPVNILEPISVPTALSYPETPEVSRCVII